MAFNNRMNKKSDRVHHSNKNDRQHSFGKGHRADSSDRFEDHRKDDRKFGAPARFGGNREEGRKFERRDDGASQGRYTGYSNRSENRESPRDGPSPRRFENRAGPGSSRPSYGDRPSYNREERTERSESRPRFEDRPARSFSRDAAPKFSETRFGDRSQSASPAPRYHKASEKRAFARGERPARSFDRPQRSEGGYQDRRENRDGGDSGRRMGGPLQETAIKNVFEYKGNLYTKNAFPGEVVYGERLFTWDGVEYRQWDVMRSKLGAGIKKGITQTGIEPGCTVLYLGCSTGTTVSHVSEIITMEGIVYALDVAPRVMRDMVLLSKKRKNIYPLMADANRPTTFSHAVPQVDTIFMDIAQSNQVEIFLKNVEAFLKPGGLALLSLKSRSIDISKSPQQIYTETRKDLEKHMTVLDCRTLDPFEKDHALFVCKKR